VRSNLERECCNDACGWRGVTDRMLGTVGPLCPECGEVTELTGNHGGGSLNTTPPIGFTQRVPIKPAIGSLDDDTPLQGGFCNMEPGCDACQ
jgi:hypothetical protein